MIALKSLREYWESMVDRVDGLKKAVMLTVESNMADKVTSIKEADSPTLFYLAPSAEGSGGPDSYSEETMCVIFVMAKYNPRSSTSADTLEQVQPIAEAVKALLLQDRRRPCHFLHSLDHSISTIPETEFFANWAGWSIAFKA